MQIASGMKLKEQQLISEKLGHLLADVYVLYIQTQCCHWNLVGPEFYSIHILLDKQYHELIDPIDELAERIRALGGYVDASLVSFKSVSSLKEMRTSMPSHKALELLLNNQEAVIRHARQICTLADKHHDHATVDFIGHFMGLIEKFSWMVRSQLTK